MAKGKKHKKTRFTHPCDVYFRAYGKYPSLTVNSGFRDVRVSFAPGYAHIHAVGSRHAGVYLTRSALLTLLPKLTRFAGAWEKSFAEDFDVPQREREAYLFELGLSREMAAAKRARGRGRTLDDQRRAERQHRRWLKARARAAAKRGKS